MTHVIHFLKINRLRIVVWLLALVATIPAGLWAGSILWDSLNDLFNPTGLWGQFIVLCCSVVMTFIVTFAGQGLAKVLVKKFVPIV